MTTRSFVRAISLISALTLAAPALAAPQENLPIRDEATAPQSGQESRGRIRQNNRRERAPAAPSAEQIQAEAQAVLAGLGNGCQVTEARYMGETAEKVKAYEAACATGPGFIVIASTPAEVMDCVILAHSASVRRAQDPNADVGGQCELPANQDVQAVMTAYAREAGVPCTVDQVAVVGQNSAGAVTYEVGCNGADGYWISKADANWTRTECLEIVSTNATCRFTTPEEQVATVKSWLAGAEGTDCDIQQVRLMGQNANGRFFEAKCNGTDGFIARFDEARAVQQVYPCATAQQIGGGCTLTAAAPAAATTEPQS